MRRTNPRGEPEVPPHNLDMERASLGCCMIDRDAIAVCVRKGLEPTDYYSSAHTRIFAAILTLWIEEKAIDLMTVYDRLRESEHIEEIGGLAYLGSLERYVMTTTHIGAYAIQLIELSVRRRIIELSGETLSDLYTAKIEAEEAMSRIDQRLIELKQRMTQQEAITMATIGKHLKEIRERGRKKTLGIPSGIYDLDALTAGFHKTDLAYIAGRPSMGKTSFAMGIARAAAQDDHTVDVFSLEMSAEQLQDRLISMISRVNLSYIRRGNLGAGRYDAIHSAAEWLQQLPILIEDKPGMTIRELCAIAEERKTQYPNLGLVIVDYVQLVRGPKSIQRQGECAVVSHVSGELKRLARSLDIAVVACAQLNRSVDDRPGKRPELGDLRQSGQLEADADLVVAPYRDTNNDPDFTEQAPVKSSLVVLKQRNGPIAELKRGVWFHRQTATFLNVDRDYADTPPVVAPHVSPENQAEMAKDDEIPFFGSQGPPVEDE